MKQKVIDLTLFIIFVFTVIHILFFGIYVYESPDGSSYILITDKISDHKEESQYVFEADCDNKNGNEYYLTESLDYYYNESYDVDVLETIGENSQYKDQIYDCISNIENHKYEYVSVKLNIPFI